MKLTKYPFPGVLFSNREQFEDYKLSHQNLLDFRYAFEQSLASEKTIVIRGVCPLTLQHTTFTSRIANGEKRADGKSVPDWRSEQQDANGIYMPDRAVAHYAIYNAAKSGLGRVLLIAGTEALLHVLNTYADQVDHLGFSDALRSSSTYDTILIVNRLEEQDDINASLKGLYARLAEGGHLYLHANFHYGSEKSERHSSHYWALGWDLLDVLRDSGYTAPAAITFWSPEIGYFGPSNLVFEAVK